MTIQVGDKIPQGSFGVMGEKAQQVLLLQNFSTVKK